MKHHVSRWIIPSVTGLAMMLSMGLAPRRAAAAPLQAGDWLVRIGFSNVDPKESSSNPGGGLPPAAMSVSAPVRGPR